MATKKQKRAELEQHLFEQLEFLKISCKIFDSGILFEAKRIALVIRTLVHDTKSSHALLNQLSIKNKINYISTSNPYDPLNLVTHTGLVSMKISNNGTEYVPKCENKNSQTIYNKKFDSWWNEIVISDNKKNTFSRKKIVLAVTNKDGGAHIDPELDEAFHNLTRENGAGWIMSNGNEEKAVAAIELVSIRQIGYEIIKSLEEYLRT